MRESQDLLPVFGMTENSDEFLQGWSLTFPTPPFDFF